MRPLNAHLCTISLKLWCYKYLVYIKLYSSLFYFINNHNTRFSIKAPSHKFKDYLIKEYSSTTQYFLFNQPTKWSLRAGRSIICPRALNEGLLAHTVRSILRASRLFTLRKRITFTEHLNRIFNRCWSLRFRWDLI